MTAKDISGFSVASAANAISGSFGHYHAIGVLDSNVVNTRLLQEAWIASGQAQSAWLEEADDKIRSLYQGALAPGITGWLEIANPTYKDWPTLMHLTGSGRLFIEAGESAGDPSLRIKVFAGPLYYGGPGREILEAIAQESGNVQILWSRNGEKLVAEKPNRLSELWRYVDKSLGGIFARSDLTFSSYVTICETDWSQHPTGVQEITSPAGYRYDAEVNLGYEAAMASFCDSILNL